MASDARTKLQELTNAYAKNLPDKIWEIASGWEKLKHDWTSNNWEDLYRLVHTLTGTAGTFGFKQISECAREFSNLLNNSKNSAPNKAELHSFENAVAKLTTLTNSSLSSVINVDFMNKLTQSPATQSRLIYFLSNDQRHAGEVISQLSHSDCNIKLFHSPQDLVTATDRNKPNAIMIEITSLSTDDINELIKLSKKDCTLPIIAIADNNELKTQIESVRIGCRFYFIKPLDITLLTEKLNQIFNAVEDPYRVLIVEDSVKVADYIAIILQEAGMHTAVITDPYEINNALVSFKPELILMDLYIPKISGLELAAILRLQPTYESIPIVFLSSEYDKTKQLEAMSLGGDDFITKPVSPEYLVWSVRNRAERYRGLRNLMLKDSLTGLFTFTSLLNQLEVELLRASRDETPFSFAMLDLDHFKNVNDTYGHLVGNQVLKSFSLFLQQRLRRTDIIGRYGGEEFALLLPNTTKQNAINQCEKLRKNFAQMIHCADHAKFTVTFSAGVASYPPYASSKEIITAADCALYTAKNQGRNRVA